MLDPFAAKKSQVLRWREEAGTVRDQVIRNNECGEDPFRSTLD